MSRDVHLIDKSGSDDTVWSLDNLSTQRWLEGKVAGAEELLGHLFEHSVSLFRDRKDAQAFDMRKLAEGLRDTVLPKLREGAERHKKEFPEEVT